MQDLIRGREKSLDYFFHLYYTSLSYFVLRILQDEFLAEEIASEAFIKLWNHRAELSTNSSIKSWLYHTARNSAIDHLRKVKRLQSSREDYTRLAQATETTILHSMIESETLARIIRNMDLLPPKCRKVFRMIYLQNKTYSEVAREMNISPDTVRKQKVRAIRLIKSFGGLAL